MSDKRVHRKIERTADQQRELEEVRERFQCDRPGLQDLLATGDAHKVVPQGEYLELCAAMKDDELQEKVRRAAGRNAVNRAMEEP